MIDWIRRHKLHSGLAAFIVLAVVLALVIGTGSGPGNFTARGGETVCIDAPDVTDGTQVTVTDSAGKVIGTGALADDNSPAAVAAVKQYVQLNAALGEFADGSSSMSVYTFNVTVPAGQPRYGISTSERRGTVWFTETQMRKGPQVTLGCS